MAKRQASDSHPTRRQVGRGFLRPLADLIPAGQRGVKLRLFGDWFMHHTFSYISRQHVTFKTFLTCCTPKRKTLSVTIVLFSLD